jgi:DNA-binding CsgD family transcriptional regulator/PAS domain-containing protein
MGMIGIEGVSAQALSDTIGAIYDCALDPERWVNAVSHIVELCESAGGSMCVHHTKDVQNDCMFEVGYSRDFYDGFEKEYPLSPFAAFAPLGKVGDVATTSMLCSDQELFESRIYREVLSPFGCNDFIGLLGLKTTGRIAVVSASRANPAPRYSERDISLLRLLSPHVCRSLTISDALDIRTLRSEMLEATLDGLTAGVYLLRRDGRVIYMNATAERQLKSSNALRVVNHRLFATDAEACTLVAKAIGEVTTGETDAGLAGHSLAIPDASGAGYIATLLPLERGRRQSVMAPFAASVAVFVQDPAQVPLMPGEAFAKLYRLTGGELRVLLALAQGLGAKEAADMLGIGEPTVRTHLQRMFSKTGTSRQAELLQLLQSSAPPTAFRP